MALTRFKAIESLRYCALGEWGKLLGLDRIPEARTLRSKSGHSVNTIRLKAGVLKCAAIGWNQPRSKRVFHILMVMCASITATKPNCPSIMLPGKNAVFERPPTIGSMPWMDSLLWPLKTEFSEYTLTLPTGERTQVKLAERGVCLSNNLWVREIRKLTESGYQTAILATDYQADLILIGAKMFARWCQENYFKYMREHYGLDKLADYSVATITEPTQVVNPVYHDLDGKVRSQVGKLGRMLANFGAMHFEGTLDDEKISLSCNRKRS